MGKCSVLRILLRPQCLAVAPSLLYFAAINPYFEPGQYDNIVYFFGASSLAQTGSFSFWGKHIVDWAPGLSVFLLPPMLFGIESVVVCKALVALCVALGLHRAFALLNQEGRSHPAFIAALSGLIPTAFLSGTRIMSEWLFLLLSISFLAVLHRLRTERKITLGLVAGGLLGMAVLTRFVGVLLGVAILTQIAQMFSQRTASSKLRAVAPELVCAFVGALPFLLWKWKLHLQIQAGTAVAQHQSSLGFIPKFTPWSAPYHLGDLLIHASRLETLYPQWGTWGARAAGLGLLILAVIGLVHQMRKRRRDSPGSGLLQSVRPSDAYTLTMLFLLVVVPWKHTRYLIPVAPFLLSYVWDGARASCRWLRPKTGDRLAAWLAVGSTLGLVIADGTLLAYGNGRTFGGLCALASPDAASFYRGYWRDLYLAGSFLQTRPREGPVALTTTGDTKYVYAFSRRRSAVFDLEPNAPFIVVPEPAPFSERELNAKGYLLLRTFGSVSVYSNESREAIASF